MCNWVMICCSVFFDRFRFLSDVFSFLDLDNRLSFRPLISSFEIRFSDWFFFSFSKDLFLF